MSIQGVASLEGMRIVIDGGWCQLDMYEFGRNAWAPLSEAGGLCQLRKQKNG